MRAPALHLVSRDQGRQEITPRAALTLRRRKPGRHDENTGMSQHAIRIALVVHRHGDRTGERSARPRHARAVDPERGALACAHASPPEALVLEDGAPGRLRALGLRACETHGDGVVHEGLRLVDDRGRQILEAQRGDEFSEPKGERRLFHNL